MITFALTIRLFRAVHAAGGLCIADEVQVGFGRCGTGMWVFEKQGKDCDSSEKNKLFGNK